MQGKRAADALRAALAKGGRTVEFRHRAEQLLPRLEAPLPSTDFLRTLRAAAVLEYAGDEPASALLRHLASGSPEARLTREARTALARLTHQRTMTAAVKP